jgi:hypothetical protein
VGAGAVLEKASGHKYSEGIARFAVGMMRLANRDRDEARKQSTLATNTNTIGSFDDELARAYPAHMEADPTWPNWIQDKTKQ